MGTSSVGRTQYRNVRSMMIPTLSAVAALALLAAGLGVAMFGAISLFTPPALPKLLLFAAITFAALIAMPRRA